MTTSGAVGRFKENSDSLSGEGVQRDGLQNPIAGHGTIVARYIEDQGCSVRADNTRPEEIFVSWFAGS
jgi:hypothetical protein